MEIHGQHISRLNSPQGVEHNNSPTEPAKPEPASTQTPAVEVSERGRQLSELSELVQNSDDIRSDLVNEMKAKIEAGEYKVDFDKLATNMAEEV